MAPGYRDPRCCCGAPTVEAMTCRCPLCREDTKRLCEEWRDKHAPGPWPQPSWWNPKVLRSTESWFATFRKGERG